VTRRVSRRPADEKTPAPARSLADFIAPGHPGVDVKLFSSLLWPNKLECLCQASFFQASLKRGSAARRHRGVIFDRNIFIMQATGLTATVLLKYFD
jgi:hypothetical protein